MPTNQNEEHLPPGAIPPLDQMVTQLSLAQATEAARAGHYLEAETFLEGIPERDKNPSALDLLARIRAQQGRLAEAEIYWKKALEIDPANSNFMEGMTYVTRSQRRAGWLTLTWPALLQGAGAIAVILLFVFLLFNLNSLNQNMINLSAAPALPPTLAPTPTLQPMPATPVPPANVTNKELDALAQTIQNQFDSSQAGQEQILAQLSTLQFGQPTLAASTPVITARSPEIKIDVAGVQTIPQGDGVMLIFDQGLFRWSYSLDPAMEATLTQVGQKLKELGPEVQVAIIGFRSLGEDTVVNPYGTTLSDAYLDAGLMRAIVALNFLENRIPLPAELFTIQSQGTTPAPFPNDTPENQLRNRTVILLITRK